MASPTAKVFLVGITGSTYTNYTATINYLAKLATFNTLPVGSTTRMGFRDKKFTMQSKVNGAETLVLITKL